MDDKNYATIRRIKRIIKQIKSIYLKPSTASSTASSRLVALLVAGMFSGLVLCCVSFLMKLMLLMMEVTIL